MLGGGGRGESVLKLSGGDRRPKTTELHTLTVNLIAPDLCLYLKEAKSKKAQCVQTPCVNKTVGVVFKDQSFGPPHISAPLTARYIRTFWGSVMGGGLMSSVQLSHCSAHQRLRGQATREAGHRAKGGSGPASWD